MTSVVIKYIDGESVFTQNWGPCNHVPLRKQGVERIINADKGWYLDHAHGNYSAMIDQESSINELAKFLNIMHIDQPVLECKGNYEKPEISIKSELCIDYKDPASTCDPIKREEEGHICVKVENVTFVLFKRAKEDIPIELEVVHLTRKVSKIKTTTNSLVTDLKLKLQEEEGIPPDQQRLVFKRTQLNEAESMYKYSLKNGDRIHLFLRLRGGMMDVSSGADGYDSPKDSGATTINRVRLVFPETGEATTVKISSQMNAMKRIFSIAKAMMSTHMLDEIHHTKRRKTGNSMMGFPSSSSGSAESQ